VKTALHTVSYAGVWPGQARLGLDETIQRAASLGYDGVMIMAKRPHLSILDASDQEIERLRDLMNDEGVALACMAGYTNFTADAAHADIPVNEMQIAYVTQLARLTQALGGSVIRIFTGYEDEQLSLGQVRERCRAAIKECARRAADFGCTIAVQNHHDFACHYEAFYDFIVDVDEPNCRAAFDAWSPTLHGDDVAAAARKLAPLTVHTTCADYVYRPRFKYQPSLINYTPQTPAVQAMAMGEGMVDYEGFLNALKDAGYDGYVGYEMCAPLRGGGGLENLDACAAQFLEFIKPWL